MVAAAGLAPTLRATVPPLRFGLTPVILDDRVGFLGDSAHWLESQFGRPVVFVQRARYREILDLLFAGRLDLAWICGYPYVQHRASLDLLAVPLFQGRPLYESLLIVAADSAIGSLAELQGRLFAWSDPDSNSGYLYPRFLLARRGQDPDHYFRRTFFTWGHPRSVEAVADGLVDGAAVDSYVWETLALRHPELTARTRVIERSPLFGFPPLVAGPALGTAERERIRRVFVGQVNDPMGRRLLNELNLDGFSIEPPALFDSIAQMAAGRDRREPT